MGSVGIDMRQSLLRPYGGVKPLLQNRRRINDLRLFCSLKPVAAMAINVCLLGALGLLC